MRKLASIQRVLNLIPIPGADAIELAQINGWQCVVKKGEFQVGDLGVYLEIDAVPPDLPLFEFLWKGQPKRPGSLRIKTMRLRGALSQGLLIPLARLADEGFPVVGLPDGTDVTELLGVYKYEPPPPEGMGDYGGPFPSLVFKTDEVRAQSFPQLIAEMQGLPYAITVKCDGTSSTFCMWEDRFHACGRNHSIKEGDNIFWHVARSLKLGEVMAAHPTLALQGEIVGPGIQKNRMGLKKVELRAFNLFDMKAGQPLGHDDLVHFCKDNGVPMVPVIERGESFDYTLGDLLKLAEGKYEGTQNEREGIVIRPLHYVFSPTLAGRLSFKVISNKFLLKGGD